MHLLSRVAAACLPRQTLRAQLALLYAAVFGLACIAVAGIVVIFNPDVQLGRSNCAAASDGPIQGACSRQSGPSVISTVADNAKQNAGALAMVALFAILALALGWLIAGRVLRPLRTITATARDISAGNLHQRLAVAGPDDEFRQLGETLDGLFGRLEGSFQAQRHFVANASHEMRTPVAAEKTVLQVALADPDATIAMLRSACEKALQWNGQQERLIDSLLTLASSEREIERWEPFDLAGIAAKAVLDRHQDAGSRGIRLSTDLSAAPATGDPALAECLIANLVSNAVRHNVDGGRAEISTTITDGRAVVTVSNTGPLVPPDEIDRLFQPFQRLGTQRLHQAGGHGLGLAIVRAIVCVHGAELSARARAEGGLDISVSFP